MPPVAVGLALAIGVLAACGVARDDEPSAAAILQQTFRDNRSAIHDGYLSLSVQIDSGGPRAGDPPVTITLLGPIAAARRGERERFALELAAMSAKKATTADVLSTGRRVLVTLDDGTYDAGSLAAADDGRGLPVTRLDPLRWIDGAQARRRERAAGVDTIRIVGDVDVEPLLDDLDGLLPAADADHPRASALSPKLRKQIAAAVDSSSIDVWTGAADRLLRQIAVRVAFSFDEAGPAPLAGAASATINVHLRLDDVNEDRAPAATFAAPRGTRARPLVAGVSGGSRALLDCVALAGGSSSELARCLLRRAR